MKGASKVIMGATLVMVVSLAIVLALILVLLAELYCSLLLRRRRQLKKPTTDDDTSMAVGTSATAAATTPTSTTYSQRPPPQEDEDPSTCSPLSSIYAQGVLHAPRNFLFPAALPCKQKEELEKVQSHLSLLHQVLEIQAPESNTSPHRIGILSPTSPISSASFASSPQLSAVQEISIQVGSGTSIKEKACGAPVVENFVYISNPIYDDEADILGRPSMPDTPFETPDSSPSRLENSGSSGDDDKNTKAQSSEAAARVFYSSPHPMTPPLSPMKKLPAQACSVSLRDARSIGTSGSDSNSNNGLSSSSSGSPCTSPSW